MGPPTLTTLDGRADDRLGNGQHETEVAGRMPSRVVAARAGYPDAGGPLPQLEDGVQTALETLLVAGQPRVLLHRLLELLL